MMRNYYKVVEDFEAPTIVNGSCQLSGELLAVEKGDIIVDVKPYNDNLLVGKTLVSQKLVQIPKGCIEELKDDDEDDERPSESEMSCEKERQEISEEKKRSSSVFAKESPIKSQNIDEKHRPTSIVKPFERKGDKNQITSDGESEIADEYVPLSPNLVTNPLPKAPPRSRRKRESNGNHEKFRSRESDEGYNSCSHYSGDKQPDNEDIVTRRSYCNTTISEAPLLSSFRESPQRTTSPRPSIQDEDGYEIPAFTPRVSILNGELASSEEKGVMLKLIYQRKSTNLDDTQTGFASPDSVKIPLDSIGENSESVYETWATDQKSSNLSQDRRKLRKERVFVLLYFAISILIAIGLFLVMLHVCKTSPLLCFTTAVNVFAIVFVGLLTMGKRRWLCIATLLAPSLFSKKVKTGLCITLCVLIISGPGCNVANNLRIVWNCNSAASNASDNTPLEQSSYEQVVKVMDPYVARPSHDLVNGTVNFTKNSSPREKSKVKTCKSALRTALENVLPICSAEDKSCVMKMVEPRFGDICQNFSEAKAKCSLSERKQKAKPKKTIKNSIFNLRNILLQMLPLLLLLLVHEAYWYNRDYLSNKEMDNVYITGKLQALDCERKERGMRNKLFPLRKLEFRTYVLPSSFLQTSEEVKQVVKWVIVWLSLGLVVLLTIFLDKAVYEALSYLNEHASNQCAIAFTSLEMDIVYSICIVLALLIIAIVFQSYALRSRSRICSFFYPKKESARGVYLYYKILHDRAQFWKACKERGRMLSEGRRIRWRIGIGHRLFHALPNQVRDLIEKLFVYRCMICNSLSARKTFVCRDEDCYATFCYECYIDMGQTCISCRPSAARDSVFNSI